MGEEIAFYAPMKPPDHAVPSGDRRLARLLMAALKQAGFEPFVASRLRSLETRGDVARQKQIAAAAELEATHLIDALSRRPAGRPCAWFTYHVYYKAPDWLGPKIAHALNIPYIIAEASFAPKRAGGPWDLGHRATASAIKAADLVFCLSAHDLACVAPLRQGLRPAEVLQPFIDLEDGASAEQKGPARPRLRAALAQEYGLDVERHWLLSVAMLREGDKFASFEILADVAAALPGEDWQMLIAGDGPAATAIKQLFAKAPKGCVHFIGQQPRATLNQLYAASDLYLWPASGEAFGMAFLEAQAAGLAVIAGNERGVPQVVRDGKTGILIPPSDIAGFVQAIGTLLQDPVQRRQLGRAGCRFVRDEASLPAAAKHLHKRLSDCINMRAS